MQYNEIYYPKDGVCVHFPSPLVVQCGCMPGNRSCGTQQKPPATWRNTNWFSSVKGTKAGESLLKKTSWIVAAGLERLDLPNDSLQVLAE